MKVREKFDTDVGEYFSIANRSNKMLLMNTYDAQEISIYFDLIALLSFFLLFSPHLPSHHFLFFISLIPSLFNSSLSLSSILLSFFSHSIRFFLLSSSSILLLFISLSFPLSYSILFYSLLFSPLFSSLLSYSLLSSSLFSSPLLSSLLFSSLLLSCLLFSSLLLSCPLFSIEGGGIVALRVRLHFGGAGRWVGTKTSIASFTQVLNVDMAETLVSQFLETRTSNSMFSLYCCFCINYLDHLCASIDSDTSNYYSCTVARSQHLQFS